MVPDDIDKFQIWNKEWTIKFNVEKCKVMELVKGIKRQTLNCKVGSDLIILKHMKEMNDLLADQQIAKIARESYKV